MSMNGISRLGRGLRSGAGILALVGAAGLAGAQTKVVKPEPTVPEVFTLMGQYVRVAYNNVGFVTLGYRLAQNSVGEEWLALEVGMTVRGGARGVTVKREQLSIQTPDGKVIPLATQRQYAEAGYLTALNNRAKVIRDTINYFPVDVSRGCGIKFFANLGSGGRQLSYDEVELSYDRACMGRLYFHVPGGIKVGQHWLKVAFEGGEVQVPFRILTKEEAKEFEKTWEDIKEEHEESLKKE